MRFTHAYLFAGQKLSFCYAWVGMVTLHQKYTFDAG